MQARILIYLVVTAGLLLAYFQGSSTTHAESRTYDVYEVTIQGTAGGRSFTRGGALFLTTVQAPADSGGVETVLFWLVSGKPSGTAGRGAIWLASNSGFYGIRAGDSYATVVASASELQARFAPEVGAANANAFSISANPRENGVRLVDGQLSLHLNGEGQMEGTIALVAVDDPGQMPLHYNATITGHFAGQRTW